MEWFMLLFNTNGKEEGSKLPFLAAVKEEICGHFHWLRRCGIIRDDHQMNDGLRTWWNLAVRIFWLIHGAFNFFDNEGVIPFFKEGVTFVPAFSGDFVFPTKHLIFNHGSHIFKTHFHFLLNFISNNKRFKLRPGTKDDAFQKFDVIVHDTGFFRIVTARSNSATNICFCYAFRF